MSGVYRPTVEIALTPEGGVVKRAFRLIDLRSPAGNAPNGFVPLATAQVPTFHLNGIRKALGEIVRDLNVSGLNDLIAFYDHDCQLRIGEGLSRMALGDDVDLGDPDVAEIRIRINRSLAAVQDDLTFADDLAVAPWALMTAPLSDDDDAWPAFLCDPVNRFGRAIAVTLRGDRPGTEIRLPQRVHVRLFISDGVVGSDEAERHRAACVSAMEAAAAPGFPADALTSDFAETFDDFVRAPDAETPAILYLVTHGWREHRTVFLQTGPGPCGMARSISLPDFLRKLKTSGLDPALLVIFACKGDGDAKSGAGRILSGHVPALLVSRMELSFAVALSVGPTFLGLVARQRFTPAQAFAEALEVSAPEDGSLAASWSALTLHANYETWRSEGTVGNRSLDPHWRRDLPLLLDRRTVIAAAQSVGRSWKDLSGSAGGLSLRWIACRGGPRSGLDEYLLRLRMELAECGHRVTIYDTVLDWGANLLPDAVELYDEALRDTLFEQIGTAISGLHAVSAPQPRSQARNASMQADALADMMRKAVARAGGPVPCFLFRHTALRAKASRPSQSQVLRTYVDRWAKIVEASQRGPSALIILAISVEVRGPDAPALDIDLAAGPARLTFDQLEAVLASDVRSHIAEFDSLYDVSEERAAELARPGEFLDVTESLQAELFRSYGRSR